MARPIGSRPEPVTIPGYRHGAEGSTREIYAGRDYVPLKLREEYLPRPAIHIGIQRPEDYS